MTATYSGRREGSVITTALDGMGRCDLWSRSQRGQEEGKGVEEQDRESLSLTIGSYGRGWCQERACVFAFGYGAVEESGGRNRTLSSSVRLTRPAAKKQRLHKETKTGR